jgi:hypothetical protein
MALVAVNDAAPPSVERIGEYVESTWRESSPIDNVGERGNVATFNFGEATAAVTFLPMPIPWEQLEGPCATAWYWPEAADALRSHPRHILVTLIDEGRDSIDKAWRLTKLTAAVAACADADGIFWGPGRMVHPPGAFIDLSRDMTREHLPLYLWIDFRIEGVGADTFRLYTTGMEPLGQKEIEVERYAGEPQQLLETVYNVAHYALDKEKPLSHGDTIGASQEERIAIHLGPSMLDPNQQVVRLEF